MEIGSVIIAVYLDQFARESYKSFPVLSFAALFVVLLATAALLFWLFKRRR
jgi:hypothetical protein